MSASVRILAEPAVAGIAGLEGEGDGPLVALGNVDTGPRTPDLRWLDVPATDAAPPGARLAAPAGDGLWSRAPWPVRDDLFDLPPPPPGAGLLVVTGAHDHGELLEKLAARAIAVVAEPELTADALAAAAAVAFPPVTEGDPVPGARQDALPAAVFAPLAARRPLIAPRVRVTFGLLPAVDHLAASTDDEVVQYADALLAHPEAFALQVELGRVAAERRRASAVYARLVAELEADGCG
jgi:hypothetical protein